MLSKALSGTDVPRGLHEPIARETGRLPGEVARLLNILADVLPQLSADVASLPEVAAATYRLYAVKYFMGRINALLDKARFNKGIQETTLRRLNAEFAQCVFSGHHLKNPPELWQDSGLIVYNTTTTIWHMVCPAVHTAVIEYLS